ncbi:Hint domain containing protein [uncultured Caudovirales phage]|uniref:Hint domain containing protein n=1 Tax=uncultured Caudovirales phage TaxID=2100421 RepID=A0A6J5KSY2_9CAUD|nr:Hint domain containing protein [uncultured Caudovirales phage]
MLVREVTDQDPTGRFTSDITWMQITPATTVGGDITVVAPRWTYVDNIFYPPQYGNATVYIQSGAQFSNLVSFTGNAFINGDGVIDDSCWLPLAVVNVSATNSTAHFVSYSSHIFDVALNVGNSIVYINSPINSFSGGGEFVNGGGGNGNGTNTGGGGGGGPAAGTGGSGNRGDKGSTDGSPVDNLGSGNNACFTPDTKVSMSDGSYKSINEINVGDTLMGDNGVVTVINKWVGIGNYVLVDFNKKGYFITSNHPVLTDNGWGSVDVALFAATEPQTYLRVLQANGNRPLVTVKIGTKLATWFNGTVVYETLHSMDLMPPIDIEVYNLNVTGDDRYIANGYIVHNK